MDLDIEEVLRVLRKNGVTAVARRRGSWYHVEIKSRLRREVVHWPLRLPRRVVIGTARKHGLASHLFFIKAA